jgi:hypothetical protein
MMEVYGYSDDLIYMEQEDPFNKIGEEILISSYGNQLVETYITFTDGTKILVYYGKDGNWRIVVIEEGRNFIKVIGYEERDSYSDLLVMHPFNVRSFYGVEQRKVENTI